MTIAERVEQLAKQLQRAHQNACADLKAEVSVTPSWLLIIGGVHVNLARIAQELRDREVPREVPTFQELAVGVRQAAHTARDLEGQLVALARNLESISAPPVDRPLVVSSVALGNLPPLE